MEVLRLTKTETDQFQIGDKIQIKIGEDEYYATAFNKIAAGTEFEFDTCLKDKHCMNKDGEVEGGYDASDLKSYLYSLEADIDADLRERMVRFDNGNLLNILSLEEVFGLDSNWDERKGQIEWFKDRRHRIASYNGIDVYYWLSSVTYSTDFAHVDYSGRARHDSASSVYGVRPRFILN